MDFSINLTNYSEHPTDKAYLVFNFKSAEQAGYFENLLIEHKVWYEKDVENETQPIRYLFAVKKREEQKVVYLNNLAIGKYRKPFISDPIFRWFTLLLFFVLLGLGLLGVLVK